MGLRLQLAGGMFLLCATASAAGAATTEYYSGDCQVHRNSELRCAASFPAFKPTLVIASLVVSGGSRQSTGTAQYWATACGAPGERVGGTFPVSGSMGRTEVAHYSQIIPIQACPEVFVFDCKINGQPASCREAFPAGQIKLEFIVRQ